MSRSLDTAFAIGIPAYARSNYLVIAVESAVAQTLPASEIIISQNQHPDPDVDAKVRTTIEHLVDSYPNVRAYRNTTQCNLSSNINSIADRAESEYIAFIGDDDRFKPHCLERLNASLDEDYDVLFSNHHIIDADGRISVLKSEENTSRYGRTNISAGLLNPVATNKAVWRCSIPIFSCVIKTQRLRELRLLDDLQGADTEFFIRLSRSGGLFGFVPEYLTEIRYHDQNIAKPASQYAKLVDSLEAIQVTDEVMGLKNQLQALYTYTTVKKFINDGDLSSARDFLGKYAHYVRDAYRYRMALQKFCLALPDSISSSTYAAVTRLIRKLYSNPAALPID